jgi:hypothetical protein
MEQTLNSIALGLAIAATVTVTVVGSHLHHLEAKYDRLQNRIAKIEKANR